MQVGDLVRYIQDQGKTGWVGLITNLSDDRTMAWIDWVNVPDTHRVPTLILEKIQ